MNGFASLSFLFYTGCVENKVAESRQPTTVTIESHEDGEIISTGVEIELVGLITNSSMSNILDLMVPQWTANGVPICPEAISDKEGYTVCNHEFEMSGDTALQLTVTAPDGEVTGINIVLMVDSDVPPTAEIILPTSDGFYYSDHPTDHIL